MTDLPSTDGLTDQQLIERLAVEVMGWEWKPRPGYSPSSYYQWQAWFQYDCFVAGAGWNPLSNWNHTMKVFETAYRRAPERMYAAVGPLGSDFFGRRGRRAICLAALQAVTPSTHDEQ